MHCSVKIHMMVVMMAVTVTMMVMASFVLVAFMFARCSLSGWASFAYLWRELPLLGLTTVLLSLICFPFWR